MQANLAIKICLPFRWLSVEGRRTVAWKLHPLEERRWIQDSHYPNNPQGYTLQVLTSQTRLRMTLVTSTPTSPITRQHHPTFDRTVEDINSPPQGDLPHHQAVSWRIEAARSTGANVVKLASPRSKPSTDTTRTSIQIGISVRIAVILNGRRDASTNGRRTSRKTTWMQHRRGPEVSAIRRHSRRAQGISMSSVTCYFSHWTFLTGLDLVSAGRLYLCGTPLGPV
jgi:hypothetical protein